MDLVKLDSKLENGTVYLKDDYKDIVLRIIVIDYCCPVKLKRA